MRGALIALCLALALAGCGSKAKASAGHPSRWALYTDAVEKGKWFNATQTDTIASLDPITAALNTSEAYNNGNVGANTAATRISSQCDKTSTLIYRIRHRPEPRKITHDDHNKIQRFRTAAHDFDSDVSQACGALSSAIRVNDEAAATSAISDLTAAAKGNDLVSTLTPLAG